VQPGDKIKSISAQELCAMLGGGSRPFLLDVREPIELAMGGAIEGACNIPVRRLKQQLDALPKTKDAEIVCVCQSGSRSLEAAHFLQQQGYSNVMNLTDGTSGWIKSGFQVVRSKQHVA
jgi:rhodanese-related sulfurtransferase